MAENAETAARSTWWRVSLCSDTAKWKGMEWNPRSSLYEAYPAFQETRTGSEVEVEVETEQASTSSASMVYAKLNSGSLLGPFKSLHFAEAGREAVSHGSDIRLGICCCRSCSRWSIQLMSLSRLILE